ncbi:MAG: Xaa-Pro peptidase family protein [archaeon]|nr:Xaa-Pro peptidase family protein [archaeon]
MNHSNKIERLRRLMSEKKLDAIIIPSFDQTSPNLFYFTEYLDSEPNAYIITGEEEILITRDCTRAKKESDIKNCTSTSTLKISDFLKHRRLENKNIGIDGSIKYSFIYQLNKKLPDLRLEDISNDLLLIRSVKNEHEIENIRTACLASDRVLAEIRQEGLIKNELLLKQKINRKIVNIGKEWSSNTIVAGDENSSNMHHLPKNSHFKKIVLVDFRIKNMQYISDISRTFILKNNEKIKKALDALLTLHSRLDDIIEPGFRASDIAVFARKTLEKAGYEKSNYGNFHNLGHGVGLQKHEYPLISEKSEDILEKNMTFTLEPAIYFPGMFGIRLKDTILMKNTGIKRLSNFRPE